MTIEQKFPDGCVCPKEEWCKDKEITPICNNYEEGINGYCEHCEHDRQCHTNKEKAK